MRNPNFIIIGATKCGTTSLYNYLDQHPNIYMSPVKEPHFFMFLNKKPTFTGPGDQKVIEQMIITDPEEYNSLFEEVDNNKHVAVGEASAMYLQSEDAAKNLSEHIPDVKLIVMLRDPVMRAFSNYRHLRRDGREKEKNFLKALEKEEKRIKEGYMPFWAYKEAGQYDKHLKTWFSYFDKRQFLFISYHNFVKNPVKETDKVFNFLGVKSNVEFDMFTHNKSGIPTSERLHRVLKEGTKLNKYIKLILPKRTLKKFKTLLYNSNLKKGPDIDVRTYNDLLNKDFTETLKFLQNEIGIDLPKKK